MEAIEINYIALFYFKTNHGIVNEKLLLSEKFTPGTSNPALPYSN